MQRTRSSRRYAKNQKSWAQKCKDFIRQFVAFMFSNIGIIGLVIGYTIAGSFMFMVIEADQYKDSVADMVALREETVARLWRASCCELNLFDEITWRDTVQKELNNFQQTIVDAVQIHGYEGEELSGNKWSFSGAFLYSLTVITTIGYGNVAPKTEWGKLATVLYAIVGMPLFLLYLSNIGDILAKSFKWTYAKCCLCKGCKNRHEQSPDNTSIHTQDLEGLEDISEDEEMEYDPQSVTVPITLCLAIMVGYVYGGAVLFGRWENWGILDGAYFCFISLSTIGFGDIVPGDMIQTEETIGLRMLGGEVRNYSTRGSPFCHQQPQHSSSKYCSNRCWSSLSSILSSLGVCLLVLGYTLLGALTFMALEGRTSTLPENKVNLHNQLRSQTVEKLWSITEDLNILYKDNWTRLAEHEVLKFQNILIRKYKLNGPTHKNYNWNFPSAFLYSLTLITTIGYGNVTPRTSWGRLITIAYALIGIPLMLVYLSTVGDTLAQYFRNLYSKISVPKKKKKNNQDPNKSDHSFLSTKSSFSSQLHEKKSAEITCDLSERPRVPIMLTLLIVLAYIAGGACLFNRLENWTFIEGSYFCFTSLGTIGFGELIPGTKESGNEISVFVSCAFILVGMAVIAMCFNLLQDETIVMVRKVNFWWSRSDKVEEEDCQTAVKSS